MSCWGFLAWRAITVRYKQTSIGVLWAFIRPFLTMVIVSVGFGRIAKLPSDHLPYAVLTFSALLPWQFFSTASADAASAVVGTAHDVKIDFLRHRPHVCAIMFVIPSTRMTTTVISSPGFRTRLMRVCVEALRVYTHRVPFKRGRGIFIRLIELLKRRGWPAPAFDIGEGLVMEFEPSLIGWTLFESGEWEPLQTSVFLPLVQAGGVVVNVGANTGYYALLAVC